MFPKYAFNADECYKSLATFDETKELLQMLIDVDDEKELNSKENILAIETHEGVFIRAKGQKWCSALGELADNQPDDFIKIEIIPFSEWNNVTKKYREPLGLFGEFNLGEWKFGFHF